MHETFAAFHIAGALSAYATAFLIFTQQVGSRRHRLVGIGYALAMLTTALSGFGLYNWGHPSIFHIFSVITVLTISRGWYAIYQYRATGERGHLANHYFNMAYSFMGLNLAAIAQALRFFSYDSVLHYLAAIGVIYFFAIMLANRLIQQVFFQRFAHWFAAKPAE